MSSCQPLSKCGYTAAIVVSDDDSHDDGQQSDEADLSYDRQLKFPKWGYDLTGLKMVWVDEVPVDDWCVTRCAETSNNPIVHGMVSIGVEVST